jgi:hypothetical protein
MYKMDDKTTKPEGQGPTMNKADTVYQVRQEKERLRKAAAGANGSKEPAPTADADPPPPPLKPLR